MAPPATAPARRPASRPEPRPAARRPPLRLFEPAPKRSASRRRGRRAQLLVSGVLVVGSLLAVVVGDTMVAQGQVRLSGLQSQVTAAQVAQKAAQVAVAQLAAPDRVVAQGIRLGLTAPAQVVDLPQVPLDVPLPTPGTAAPSKAPGTPTTASPTR